MNNRMAPIRAANHPLTRHWKTVFTGDEINGDIMMPKTINDRTGGVSEGRSHQTTRS
jgi:hypothetical protein